jgi:methylated-DNA-protein-cysteine methyltransferase-like protein
MQQDGDMTTRGSRRPKDRTPVFHRAVYRLVRQIPRGKVVTYGQVAAILGHPRAARAVGQALRMLPPMLVRTVPWQRVINANGHISHRGDILRPDQQRELLEAEGVRFDRGGRVDLQRLRWAGPRGEWLTKLRHEFPF